MTCPDRLPTVSSTGSSVQNRPYSRLVVYVTKGPHVEAGCYRVNPSIPPEALQLMVGTDERRGWVGKSDRGSDLKGAGYGRFNRNPPYIFLPAAANAKSATPYRAAPFAAAVLLAFGVELQPLRWVCLTSRALVDVEGAPFLGVAFRLSSATSNTRVPPLIRRYTPRQYF
jgi:hypothetical protein